MNHCRHQNEGGAAKAQSPTPSLDPSETGDECMVCSDGPREVVFGPCGHCVTCEHCGSRVKKCLLCRSPVVSRSKVSYEFIFEKIDENAIEKLQLAVLCGP